MVHHGEAWRTIIVENQTIKKGELGLRLDGRIEWICEHGTGHTIWVEPKYAKQNAWWVHGCDHCCVNNKEFETIKKRLKKVLG